MYTSFELERRMRRAVTTMIVIAVLALMAISWLLDRWTDLTRYFIRLIGLRHVEAWLKRKPLWLGWFFLPPMAAGFFGFKIYEFHLWNNGRYVLLVVLGLVFKFAYASIFHYIWHIYYEKLLRKRWFAHLHHEYLDVREQVLEILHAQSWYQRVLWHKQRIVEAYRRRKSRWQVARKWLKRT